jgi:hypothetical protein
MFPGSRESSCYFEGCQTTLPPRRFGIILSRVPSIWMFAHCPDWNSFRFVSVSICGNGAHARAGEISESNLKPESNQTIDACPDCTQGLDRHSDGDTSHEPNRQSGGDALLPLQSGSDSQVGLMCPCSALSWACYTNEPRKKISKFPSRVGAGQCWRWLGWNTIMEHTIL